MKTLNILFITTIAIVFLSFTDSVKQLNLQANAQSAAQLNCPSLLPSFLEKGKTYNFSFVVSQGDYNTTSPFPLSMTGRIEKIDPQSTWLYINHYVPLRKGKQVEWKYEGYSWINFSQVFQCSENTNIH